MITPAMKRYLAAIFRLQQTTPDLTVSELAALCWLNCSSVRF